MTAPRRITQEQWQRASEWPLIVAAVAFLVAYAWTVLGDLPPSRERVQDAVMWAAWGLFGVDYAVNLVLARRRWRWFWHHLLDLAIVVLPVLRPLRLLRLLSLVRIFHRFAGSAFRGRVFLYVFAYGTVLVFMAALAALDAEQNARHSQIQTFGDALWWACVTITTVGYGDIVPVTLIGKLIAVALMVAGIGIVGTVAATLASWFAQRVGQREQQEERVTRKHVDALMAEIAELKSMVAAVQTSLPATDATHQVVAADGNDAQAAHQ